MTRIAQKLLFLLYMLCISSGCVTCDSSDISDEWDLGEHPVDAYGLDVEVSVPDILDDGPELPAALQELCGDEQGANNNTRSCQIQSVDAFGDCAISLGVVFDGKQCVEVSGCDCRGDMCPRFDSLDSCAQQCGDEGWYQPAKMPLVRPDEIISCNTDYYADFIGFCDTSEDNPENRLQTLMPNFGVQCAMESRYECGHALIPYEQRCFGENWCCWSSQSASFNPMRLHQIRAMSLLPTVKQGGLGTLD